MRLVLHSLGGDGATMSRSPDGPEDPRGRPVLWDLPTTATVARSRSRFNIGEPRRPGADLAGTTGGDHHDVARPGPTGTRCSSTITSPAPSVAIRATSQVMCVVADHTTPPPLASAARNAGGPVGVTEAPLTTRHGRARARRRPAGPTCRSMYGNRTRSSRRTCAASSSPVASRSSARTSPRRSPASSRRPGRGCARVGQRPRQLGRRVLRRPGARVLRRA